MGKKINWETPDITATVEFYPTKEQGKKKSIHSGYRPQLVFNSIEYSKIVEFELVDITEIVPGSKGIVRVKFLKTEDIPNMLYTDMNFEIMEGLAAIGNGKIIEVINDILEL